MKKKLDCCMVCPKRDVPTGCLSFSLCDVIVTVDFAVFSDGYEVFRC